MQEFYVGDTRHRRRAHVREQLLHHALRRRTAADQLAVLRRRAGYRLARPQRLGGAGHRHRDRLDGLRAPHGRAPTDLVRAVDGAGRARRDRARRRHHGAHELARRSPQVRREDARRPRGAELHGGHPLHGRGQGAADVRRPARRVRPAADAAAGRDPQARCRAGAHQQRPGGSRRRARAAGHLRPRRRQAPRHLRRAGRGHRRLRRGGRSAALPLHDRARRPLSGRADVAGRLPAPRDGDARAADDQRGHRARRGKQYGNPAE